MKQGIQVLIFGVVCVFFLLLASWMPQTSTHVQQSALTGTITAVSSTATPTPSPTIDTTQVSAEKLVQEEIKLEHENDWKWINVSTLISFSGVMLAIGIGFYQWRKDHSKEQAKLDEERFQKFIEGLGSDRVEARVGAAIMLLTFLRPGYEKFYSQTFLLTVAHLRLRKAVSAEPVSLDALSQALITVFKEAFSKARGDDLESFEPDDLDASWINLDNAYLSQTDLRKIRMRRGSFRMAYFWKSQLQEAYFKHSDLEGAYFRGANLEDADFGDTILRDVNLTNTNLKKAHFYKADLDRANFEGADLTDTNPEGARSLQGTILRNVKGLSAEQLALCAAKGAIIDVAP